MATRFYLPSASYTTDIAPPADSGWNVTAAMDRLRMAKVKATTTETTVTTTNAVSGSQDVVRRQYIYGPLGAQTISGTVKGQIRVSEANAAADCSSQVVIRVLAPDGTTVRGTLLALSSSALASEWATSLTNRTFPLGGSTALSSVAAQDGDYLVVEIGVRKREASTTSRTLSWRFGDATGVDIAEDETTTTDNDPWLEFSATISDDVSSHSAVAVAWSSSGSHPSNFAAAWRWRDGVGFLSPYAPPATPLPNIGNAVAFSPNGKWIAFAHSTTPFVTVYAWDSGTGFGAKFSDPGTLPAGTGNAVAWSPDSAYLAVAHNTTPFVSVYPFSDSGFGSKVANPATLPGASGTGVRWNAAGTYIFVKASNDPPEAYPWSAGFSARVTGPTTGSYSSLGQCNIDLPPNEAFGGSGSSTPTDLKLWAWTGSAWGSAVSAPASPVGQSETIRWSPDGTVVATANSTTPFLEAWAWSAGFGSKFADPGTKFTLAGHTVCWTPDGLFVLAGGQGAISGSDLAAYPWSAGWGTPAVPLRPPPNTVNGIDFHLLSGHGGRQQLVNGGLVNRGLVNSGLVN